MSAAPSPAALAIDQESDPPSATTAMSAAGQAGPEIVRIATIAPQQHTATSRAKHRPRAEIHLSRRGSRLGTLTRGKLIKQRPIERSDRNTSTHVSDDR